MAICFEAHTNLSHFNAAPQGCFSSFCFPPFPSIEFQTHPTTGPLWSFEDLPLLSPTWVGPPKRIGKFYQHGWWCLSSLALPRWLRKCPPHQIWQLAWEKMNQSVARKRWTRSRNGSQIQHKVKSFLPHLESKYESLHSSDFKHHIHTYQPPGFILEFGHVWSSSNLSIRLSRVQPRCIEPWACEFMAKKGPRVRNVSRKEMVVGENRTLNITIFEHCNLQYQTKRWKLCQEVSFRKTEASISKMRTISVSNTAFSVMLPKSTKKEKAKSHLCMLERWQRPMSKMFFFLF